MTPRQEIAWIDKFLWQSLGDAEGKTASGMLYDRMQQQRQRRQQKERAVKCLDQSTSAF